MGKRRNGIYVSPWLSANGDGREKRFIQPGNSLFLSPAFKQLHVGARYMYLCICMECGKQRDFIFPKRAMTKYGFDDSTARRYLAELEAAGFIRTTCRCWNIRKPNEYTMDSRWKLTDKRLKEDAAASELAQRMKKPPLPGRYGKSVLKTQEKVDGIATVTDAQFDPYDFATGCILPEAELKIPTPNEERRDQP